MQAALAAIGSMGLLQVARAETADPNAPKPLAENVSLKDLMTPEQFKSAGLKKLSPEELQRLEHFLQGYRDAAIRHPGVTARRRRMSLRARSKVILPA